MDKKQTTYLEHTIQITIASRIPISVIARETGLKCEWIRAVLRGAYTDPGVNKVETLCNYITDVNNARMGLVKRA